MAEGMQFAFDLQASPEESVVNLLLSEAGPQVDEPNVLLQSELHRGSCSQSEQIPARIS
jgi:hypothetical protein